MVIKANALTREERSNVRGGNGTIYFDHVLADSQGLPKNCRLFAKLVIPKGASLGEHPHENETEFYYILSGEGTCIDEGVEHIVSAGDTVITGGGASHSIANSGDADLVFLAAIVLD